MGSCSFHPSSNSIRLPPLSTRMYHIRNPAAAAIPPGCPHPEFCFRRHSTRMSTSGILLSPPFHPDVHIRNFAAAVITPGCFASGILTSDGRGERFNFPDHTYPDPLIALTRRVSQPFCTVPQCLLKLPDMCDQHFEIF